MSQDVIQTASLFTREQIGTLEARVMDLFQKEALPVLEKIFGKQQAQQTVQALASHRFLFLCDHCELEPQELGPSSSLRHIEP